MSELADILKTLSENLALNTKYLEDQSKTSQAILASLERLENRSALDESFKIRSPSTPTDHQKRRESNLFTGLPKDTKAPTDDDDKSVSKDLDKRYIAKAPAIDAYMLQWLSVRGWIDFIYKYERFLASYGQVYPFSQFFTEKQAMKLVNQSGKLYTVAQFPSLSETKIKELVRCKLQAKNDREFLESLMNDVSFPSKDFYEKNFNFSSKMIIRLTDELQQLRQDFENVFNFHLEENAKLTVPKMDHKELSPVKIFIDSFPGLNLKNYIKFCFQEISKENSKFKNMHDFFDRLYELFQEHREIAEKSELLRKMFYPLLRPKFDSKFSEKNQQHHQIAPVLVDDETRNFPGPPEFDYSDDALDFSDLDTFTEPQSLQLLQRSQATSKPDTVKPNVSARLPCKQFTFERKCAKGDKCSYSHDDKVCRPLFLENISKNPFLAGMSRTSSTNEPYVPKPLQRLAVMESEDPNPKESSEEEDY